MCIFDLKTHLLVMMLIFLNNTSFYQISLMINIISFALIVSFQSFFQTEFCIASL